FQVRGGIRGRTEASGDLQQDVRLAREGHALRTAARGRVLHTHLRGGDLGRLDGVGKSGKPLVRDVDHAHAIRATACGQRVEQRGLAGPGRADDGDVYRQLLDVQLECFVQDPHAFLDLVAGDHARDADLRGADHLDVDSRVRQ